MSTVNPEESRKHWDLEQRGGARHDAPAFKKTHGESRWNPAVYLIERQAIRLRRFRVRYTDPSVKLPKDLENYARPSRPSSDTESGVVHRLRRQLSRFLKR